MCPPRAAGAGGDVTALEVCGRHLERLPKGDADGLLLGFASEIPQGEDPAERKLLIELLTARAQPRRGGRTNLSILAMLSTLRLLEGDAAGALDSFGQAASRRGLAGFEKAAANYHLAAEALAATGRLSEAEATLERALSRRREWDAGWSPLLARLGEWKRDLGKTDEAVRWFGEAAALDPGEGTWPRAAALALDRAGRAQDAVAWWKRVLGIPVSRATDTTLDANRPDVQRERWRKNRAEARERLKARKS